MTKDYETCKWKSAIGSWDNVRFEVTIWTQIKQLKRLNIITNG